MTRSDTSVTTIIAPAELLSSDRRPPLALMAKMPPHEASRKVHAKSASTKAVRCHLDIFG
jgi:hypothetical protein